MRCRFAPNPYNWRFAKSDQPQLSHDMLLVLRQLGYLQELCLEIFQAAGFSLMPSMKTTPLTISASSGEPFNERQPFDALSISLNTIVRHATRLPLPFVLSCRSRTVENTLSIGFVVRMWIQCSAGKS